MDKLELLYDGKAKQILATSNPKQIIMHFKDDATAYKGIKKASIKNKGIINNKISSIIYEKLNQENIPTHFIKILNDRDQLCDRVTIIPLEVIVRNVSAGSMAKRLGLEEGIISPNVILELCYKDDHLGDPLINDHHAVFLGICTYQELEFIYNIAKKVNKIIKELFDKLNIILVDFKIEFGKNTNGEIVLADEISPDTARLWEKDTLVKLDKDRFRRDLGKIEEAYIEILKRLETI